MLREGWMRAAVLAAVLVVLVFYTLFRGAPERSTVDRLEKRLADVRIETSGEAPRPLDQYARYYAQISPRTADDLPFTSQPEPLRFPKRNLVAGVLVQPGVWESRGAGIHRVARKDLPYAVHGGCRAINVLYDPKEDEIIGAWCNYEGPPPPPAPPQR